MDCKLFQTYIQSNVTCVKLLDDLVLAGVGGILQILECPSGSHHSWKKTLRQTIFPNQTIHGISINSVKKSQIAIHGGRSVALVYLNKEGREYRLHLAHTWNLTDWVHDLHWISAGREIAVLTAHSTLIRINVETTNTICQVSCDDRCILYSAKVLNTYWKDIILLGGTVYQEIIVWAVGKEDETRDKPVIHRLKGHKGVIFHVDYDEESSRICSTSDDRTLRVWAVTFPKDIKYTALGECSSKWKDASIELLWTVFGHTARVWKSCFLPEGRIATIGEDSMICIWNKLGNCEKKWSGHQGGTIRSIDYCPNYNVIATGGSDGGINLWPPAEVSPPSPLSMVVLESEVDFQVTTPKRIVITKFGDVAITTESGQVLVRKWAGWNLCFSDERFSSYSVQDLSPSRNYLALGTIDGHIVVLEAHKGGFEKIFDLKAIEGKIFSIKWSSNDRFVACGFLGSMYIWEIRKTYLGGDYKLTNTKKFILPKGKESWVTTALKFKEFLICGDREGSVHLYKSRTPSTTAPLDSLIRLHGPRGVSCLAQTAESIVSTGRDGTIRYLTVKDKRLLLLTTDKLQMDWAADVILTDVFGTLIVGFHNVHFVIWSVNERRYLLKIDCRGGHRSWDCVIDQTSLTLAFIKNKEIQFFCNPLKHIYFRSPLSGYHAKPINAGCIIKSGPNSVHRVLITGGEDNTLRAIRVAPDEAKSGFILQSHISSIRAITTIEKVRIPAFHLVPSTYVAQLVFSAGGRGQLIAWSVYGKDDGDVFAVELDSHLVNSKLAYRKPSDQLVPAFDPDTRYMDLSVASYSSKTLLVMSACSDGLFRVLSFDVKSARLSLTAAFEFHQRCILKVISFKFNDILFAVTLATDGTAAFWNMGKALSSHSSQLSYQPHSKQLHSLGINSCDYCFMNGYVVLVTGCDDASLGVNVFDVSVLSEGPVCLHSFIDHEAHTGQITGINVHESLILSVALDQLITVWSWSLLPSGLLVCKVKQFLSFIPDIHGLSSWFMTPNDLHVCVYGQGVQVVRLMMHGLENEENDVSLKKVEAELFQPESLKTI